MITLSLSNTPSVGGDKNVQSVHIKQYLEEFEPATENEIKKIYINSLKTTTCKVDPIPIQLLKDCFDALLPMITKIVNVSLEMSDVPENKKKAIVICHHSTEKCSS